MLTQRSIYDYLTQEKKISFNFSCYDDAEVSLATIRKVQKYLLLKISTSHVENIASGCGSAITGMYLFIKLNNLLFHANPACSTVNHLYLLTSSAVVSFSVSAGTQYSIAKCGLFRTKDAFYLTKLNTLEDEVLQEMQRLKNDCGLKACY